jgi:hypothetical protein
MRTQRVETTISGATSLLTRALGGVAAERLGASGPAAAQDAAGDAAALAGIWLSADRTVRLQLGADWSYRGRVEGRRRDAKGTYRPEGSGLVLCDETGLRTPVTVAEDSLELAGHHLFRV